MKLFKEWKKKVEKLNSGSFRTFCGMCQQTLVKKIKLLCPSYNKNHSIKGYPNTVGARIPNLCLYFKWSKGVGLVKWFGCLNGWDFFGSHFVSLCTGSVFEWLVLVHTT